MADERSPDLTDDPRDQGTGDAGYPETQEEGAAPTEGTETGPEAGTGGTDAPSTSTAKERDRGDSTGNPGAAG